MGAAKLLNSGDTFKSRSIIICDFKNIVIFFHIDHCTSSNFLWITHQRRVPSVIDIFKPQFHLLNWHTYCHP